MKQDSRSTAAPTQKASPRSQTRLSDEERIAAAVRALDEGKSIIVRFDDDPLWQAIKSRYTLRYVGIDGKPTFEADAK